MVKEERPGALSDKLPTPRLIEGPEGTRGLSQGTWAVGCALPGAPHTSLASHCTRL